MEVHAERLGAVSDEKIEIARLRDLLRWRDAEKELPRDSKFYLVSSCRDPSSVVCDYFDHLNREWINTNVKFWRPLGPDPGEGDE